MGILGGVCNNNPLVGTEELAHMEMICAMIHQLTRNLSEEQIKNSDFAAYFIDHTTGLYPASGSGEPWTAAYMQSKGDTICDLTEDLAADAARRRQKETFLSIIKVL